MQFINRYTLTRDIPVVTVHRCSSCGELNYIKQTLCATATYYERNSLLRRRAAEDNEPDSEKRLDEASVALLGEAEDITADSDFFSLDLCGRCKSCGNTEPWAMVKNKVVEYLFSGAAAVGIIVIMMIIGIFCSNGYSFSGIPLFLYIIPAACALVALVRPIWRFAVTQRLKRNYPSESLPRLVNDPETIKEHSSVD